VIEAYYQRGCINVDWLERYNEAVLDCGKAINADPNNADYYYCRGLAYYRMKSWPEATEDFNRLIEIDPKYMSGEVYYALGFSYNALRDYGQAIRSYTKAIELNPQQPKYYLDRGCSYFVVKNYKAAKKDWLKARELNPDEQLEKSIAKNLKILSETTGGEGGETQEEELERPKKMSWAQKQRSRSPGEKALEELLEDEEIKKLYDEYMGLCNKAKDVVSKERDLRSAITYYTDSVAVAMKLRDALSSKGKSTDLADVLEKISRMMISHCQSSLAISEASQKLEAAGRDLPALKKYLEALEEAEKMNQRTQDSLNEIKSLCERGTPELEAIGCKDVVSLEGPIMEIKSKIFAWRSDAESAIVGMSGKAAKKEKEEEVTVAPLPKKETYQEKPKNVWELMWGGGIKKEPQESQVPTQKESWPKQETPPKSNIPSSGDEGGDFE
jgi:tetratricopeptide (TPR) repeat protein